MQCSSLCQQSCLFVTRGAVLLFQTKAGVDSGSETGNEQMEVPEAAAAAESLKNNSSPSKPGAVPLQQSEEEDYASDGSSDILQPTQVSSSSMAVAASVLFLRSIQMAVSDRQSSRSSKAGCPSQVSIAKLPELGVE